MTISYVDLFKSVFEHSQTIDVTTQWQWEIISTNQRLEQIWPPTFRIRSIGQLSTDKNTIWPPLEASLQALSISTIMWCNNIHSSANALSDEQVRSTNHQSGIAGHPNIWLIAMYSLSPPWLSSNITSRLDGAICCCCCCCCCLPAPPSWESEVLQVNAEKTHILYQNSTMTG